MDTVSRSPDKMICPWCQKEFETSDGLLAFEQIAAHVQGVHKKGITEVPESRV